MAESQATKAADQELRQRTRSEKERGGRKEEASKKEEKGKRKEARR